VCIYEPKNSGVICNSGNYCVINSTCVNGECVPGALRTCNNISSDVCLGSNVLKDYVNRLGECRDGACYYFYDLISCSYLCSDGKCISAPPPPPPPIDANISHDISLDVKLIDMLSPIDIRLLDVKSPDMSILPDLEVDQYFPNSDIFPKSDIYNDIISTCKIFPSDNPWNIDISNYPVHVNSTNFINSIGADLGLHPDFGENNVGIPYMYVPFNQAYVPILFTDYPEESDIGPYPIPFNAPIESGLDRHVIVVDLYNCKLYEMYNAYVDFDSSENPYRWRASCGALFDLTNNNLRPISWTAADAAGLPMFAGLVRYEEIQTGEIKHALRFTVSRTQKAYVLPATHYASTSTNVNFPPMGLRFRLKASRNISMFSQTNQVILRALKKYGMFVADNGGNWYLSGAPSDGWIDDDLFRMKFGSNWQDTDKIRGSDFEVIDAGTIKTY
jgi:hypothetical protein